MQAQEASATPYLECANEEYVLESLQWRAEIEGRVRVRVRVSDSTPSTVLKSAPSLFLLSSRGSLSSVSLSRSALFPPAKIPVHVRGGILGDQVGYGKTAITLAMIDSSQRYTPFTRLVEGHFP